jgi:hypothetical protein
MFEAIPEPLPLALLAGGLMLLPMRSRRWVAWPAFGQAPAPRGTA